MKKRLPTNYLNQPYYNIPYLTSIMLSAGIHIGRIFYIIEFLARTILVRPLMILYTTVVERTYFTKYILLQVLCFNLVKCLGTLVY